ncbi:hypothetical protein BT63DRAFT_425372 [Microthyrium microscopicum]|uniref:Uncharacterized protein n=1 Tax=Microthyrium microscopicum TaxID=703497 RepID=A0A6A6UBR5_9PEZI|nr:hypothetical protein BT63DRAFT_425372 [Microthyrium microscopicum]
MPSKNCAKIPSSLLCSSTLSSLLYSTSISQSVPPPLMQWMKRFDALVDHETDSARLHANYPSVKIPLGHQMMSQVS